MRKVVGMTGVTVLLGGFPALSSCDFEAFEGEVVLLFGSNGSGKTTLLRAIAGLLPVFRGEAAVFGLSLVDENNRRALRRAVSYSGHFSHLYDDLTVEENLRFMAKCTKTNWAQVTGALSRLELPTRALNLETRKLSAGQRKKVALAAVLARDCELVLLDEPHAALDPESKSFLDVVLEELAAQNKTVIVASHEPERFARLSNRHFRVQGGRALQLPRDSGGR